MTASQSRGVGVKGRFGAPSQRRPAHDWRLLPLFAALLLMAACSGSGTAGASGPAAPHTPEPTSPPGRAQEPPAALTPASPLTLTIWGPDSMAPLDDVPGGAVLAAQIDAFANANPGREVRYVRKKPYGPGGLVHFLRSTAAVAPERLPDLALVDMREIGLLAESGLLQPLDTLLDTSITSDLVPFARQAGQVDEQLVAIQYEADLCFLAYNSAIVSEPPATWAQLLTSGWTYLLPASSGEGAVRDAFLPLYLALGGQLTDRDGNPYLDQDVVAAILEAYHAAYQIGVLSPAGLGMNDASDCWPFYLTSAGGTAKEEVAMTNVTSWDYGRERARLASTRVAPLPTFSGDMTGVASGWGWVLISKDSQRQQAAADFLTAILQPQAMAAWAEATYHLPTRRSALPAAIDDTDYLRFLQRLMQVASPQPREPAYTVAVEALGPAIESVAQGVLSPRAAAAEAIARVRATNESMRSKTQH